MRLKRDKTAPLTTNENNFLFIIHRESEKNQAALRLFVIWGRLKMHDMKIRHKKLQRVENAGLESETQKNRT